MPGLASNSPKGQAPGRLGEPQPSDGDARRADNASVPARESGERGPTLCGGGRGEWQDLCAFGQVGPAPVGFGRTGSSALRCQERPGSRRAAARGCFTGRGEASAGPASARVPSPREAGAPSAPAQLPLSLRLGPAVASRGRRLPRLSLRHTALRAPPLPAAAPTGPAAAAPRGRARVRAVLEGGGRPEPEGAGRRAGGQQPGGALRGGQRPGAGRGRARDVGARGRGRLRSCSRLRLCLGFQLR